MGRFLDRHGVADNPLQGLALDYVARPVARAADGPRRRRRRARGLRLLDPRRLGRRPQRAAARRLRRARQPADRRRRARRRPRRARACRPACAPASRPVARRRPVTRRAGAPTRPRRTVPAPAGQPRRHDRPRHAAALRRASRPTAATTRTTTRRRRCRDDIALLQRSRSPRSRPTSRRAASPTACIVHVWSEFGRRAQRERRRHRPRRGRRRLRDGHAAPRAASSASSPASAPAELDRDGNLRHTDRLPRRLQDAGRGLVRAWTPTGIVPDAASFSALPLLKVRRASLVLAAAILLVAVPGVADGQAHRRAEAARQRPHDGRRRRPKRWQVMLLVPATATPTPDAVAHARAAGRPDGRRRRRRPRPARRCRPQNPRSVSVRSTEFAFTLSQAVRARRRGPRPVRQLPRRGPAPARRSTAPDPDFWVFDEVGPGRRDVAARSSCARARHVLLCPLPEHEELGMRAVLTVASALSARRRSGSACIEGARHGREEIEEAYADVSRLGLRVRRLGGDRAIRRSSRSSYAASGAT